MTALEALEFEALRSLLGRYIHSPLARTELDRLAPHSDRASIENALADVAEGIQYLKAASQPQPTARGATIRVRVADIADPAPIVARLRIEGSTLDALEIRELSRLLDLASGIRATLTAASDRYPRIAAYAARIADLRGLALQMTEAILPDGSLADHASVALGRLRRDIERQRHAIQKSLERFLRAHHEDGTLQDDFITIRNDRFVVPVVAGRERRVDGVIHGASGSGHTLFVEPFETIQLNNELVRLSEEELREVHRILRGFTARLREHAQEILATTQALASIEWIFSIAEFGIEFHCAVPRISPGGERRLILREARHPLLEDILRRQRKRIVPISFDLDQQQRTLLISGPNTGGKTVTLKTAGLLALMAHAGLPVPAEEAEFPLFDEILADVGDHQSIQESLSTFSAHIVSIRQMLERATPHSFVLIDELGRATDPEEGGALGVAVLDAFKNRGAFTVASTHLLALKIYGASTPGVRNGSMGFDEATLEPTYVLRLGAPGKSAGLDIATRLGLPASLIADARRRMTSTERDIARFLSELHQRLEAVDIERNDLADRERVLTAREQSLEQTWEKKYLAKISEIERRAAELSAGFEQHAQQTLSGLSQKDRAKIAKTSREFKESIEAIAPRLAAAHEPPRAKLEEGARVRLKGVRQPATVRRILANGLIEVEAGFLKMQVSVGDLEEVLGPAQQPAGGRPRAASDRTSASEMAAAPSPPSGVTFRQGPSFAMPYREINVIGQRAEEARGNVDKFLDSAALAEVERIRIVHGFGAGILKKTISELLAHHPHVEKFYPAPPEQGGGGATIVELRG